VLGRITGELDHKHLNALRIFSGVNPSSENIAEHIHGKARAALKSSKVKVESVTVWEGENACATYSEE
jgi:6-pyruvoyltetrahydropterin/6-carboxytetrahydropterin synthase